MRFYYSDDPARDYARYDAEREEELEYREVCAECEEHIQEDECWYINGVYLCDGCAQKAYMVDTPVYFPDPWDNYEEDFLEED